MSRHITASNRKNRRFRGPAIDTSHGAPGNQRKSKHNYGIIRHQYEAIKGKPILSS